MVRLTWTTHVGTTKQKWYSYREAFFVYAHLVSISIPVTLDF